MHNNNTFSMELSFGIDRILNWETIKHPPGGKTFRKSELSTLKSTSGLKELPSSENPSQETGKQYHDDVIKLKHCPRY